MQMDTLGLALAVPKFNTNKLKYNQIFSFISFLQGGSSESAKKMSPIGLGFDKKLTN